MLKTPIQSYIGRTYNSLTVVRLTEGTVVSRMTGTFVDARCACGRVRQRVSLQSVVNGSVKTCRDCAEKGRRQKIKARRRARVHDVTPNTYGKFLAQFTAGEREEYERLMRRHGRCEECRTNVCASDAVIVVMAARGKPKEAVNPDHIFERRDFGWQYK